MYTYVYIYIYIYSTRAIRARGPSFSCTTRVPPLCVFLLKQRSLVASPLRPIDPSLTLTAAASKNVQL